MRDCSTNANKPYDVARLRIEFGIGETPWMYPLALNGRTISGVFVDDKEANGERIAELEQLVRDWCELYECPDYGDCIRLRNRMRELGVIPDGD